MVAQLTHKVLQIIDISFNTICLWSDSEITLIRIKSPPSKFTTFVANRVSQIQELTSIETWYYVPSAMNPADLVSRGILPAEMKQSSLWWKGPQFLYDKKENWPVSPNSPINSELMEYRKSETVLVCAVNTETRNVFNKFSNFKKMLRVISMCMRFINNCKLKNETRKYGPLEAVEIDVALRQLIIFIQKHEYADELQTLRKSQVVSTKSRLKSLSPFIDDRGIIRVGGRLDNANIPYDNQHQILIPGSHAFTKLLVSDEHHTLLHAGPQSLLYNIRLRYWIIGGRNLCRKIVRECIR